MSKIVIVGQQPASYEDEGNPLPVRPNSTGQRLCQMAGILPTSFENAFIRMNVSPRYEPDGFMPEYYRTDVENWLPLLEGKRVILLGPAVASAFAIPRDQYDWAHWFDHPTEHVLLSVIPHPSGLNRLYNNPELTSMVGSFLREAFNMVLAEQKMSEQIMGA